MSTPEQKDESLESARNETLVETNAQAIFENLRKLRGFQTIHRRRWIWELLQNAADATDSTTGKNRVRIDAEKNTIRFSHNGSAFSPREISHLIYHGSSKQEGENKRGKFGSGFLTVHMVSHKVQIRGILKNKETRQKFEFFLDRTGDTPQAIQQNMEVAWHSFIQSLLPVSGDGVGEFTTIFECDLDSDAEIVVDTGLADLAKTVPYVLAFVDELDEVTVSTTSGTKSWRRGQRLRNGDVTTTEIACIGLDGQSETMRVDFVGDHAKGVALAVLLRRTGENWEVVVEDSTPRLFYPLPLVDTHTLSVPFAIVSDGFEPLETRDGIYAGLPDKKSELIEKNWMLLQKVPLLFKVLVGACSTEGWLAPHKLAIFRENPAKVWIDANRFESEVLSKTIEFLQSDDAPAIVCANGKRLLRVANAKIPVMDPEGKIYSLATELNEVKDQLPTPQIAQQWAAILEGWAEVLGEKVEQLYEALSAADLADLISSCKNLNDLGIRLTSGTAVGALNWLNRLFESVPMESLQVFVQNRAVLSNQMGQLKKAGDLLLDGGVEADIKDICEKLGISVRSELLNQAVCQPVRQLFETAKGRSLSNEDCVERALKKVKELPIKGNEEAYAEANVLLVHWLIKNGREDKLAGYPMLCVTGRSELRRGKPLLAPITLWEKGAHAFADIFPADHRLEEKYADSLLDKDWRYLEEREFVLLSLFIKDKVDTLDHGQVDGSLDEIEHKLEPPITISQIAFLKGEDGVLDGLRKSKIKAKRFLQFIFLYVIKADRSWIETSEVICSCGQKHRVVPGWMHLVKTYGWVPVGRGKGDRASPESIAKLLDVELRETIFKDLDCARFLLKIGIGVSDLVRIGVPEEKRFQLDQLSARIYAAADKSTLESIEAVLDDPDLKETVLNKKHEKEKVIRNKKVGTLVEELLRKELESAGIQVTRTGIGSDFEVETDFIENEQEQLLEVSHYLLEVKSTSMPFVRMTLRQGEEAVKPENQEKYVLCVADVSSGEVDEKVVRDKTKFVFGIGPMVKTKVNDAKSLKDHENALSPSDGGGVEIDIDKSSVKLRIKEQVWIEQGASFQEFVEQVKQQA